jgi:aryl-alcohol dehydrogenase-like predicted oxidoreductase
MHMIEGFATADATDVHAKRFNTVQYATLGRTGLHCSQAGFGGYRIADGIDSHFKALHLALESGLNLIDTSANYADGESETLVGKVLTETIRSGALNRDAVIVVTKGGYLQGRNYALSQARKDQGRPFPDLVPYADGLEHCIHPEFLEDQLTRSLKRLNLTTIDFFSSA